MLATSFSPSETRKGFPCFDEPQLKATFDITIQHPAGTVAISNAQQMVTYLILSFLILLLTFISFNTE
jgi:aminopeptidase N